MSKFTMQWCSKNYEYAGVLLDADSYEEARDELPYIIENIIRQGLDEDVIMDGYMIILDAEWNEVFKAPCDEIRYDF